MWRYGVISEKTETLYAELNERAEAATSSYSATGDFPQYIYSVVVAKNHQIIWSRCLVYEFSFTDIFNDINNSYRAAILKENSLWLHSFHMAAIFCLNWSWPNFEETENNIDEGEIDEMNIIRW